jgi:acetylornithine/succinyldiaminopimelate/putrescine aminotransferase
MDDEFLFRATPPIPIDVVDSEGSYLVDRTGKKYLDFVMGWCVGNVGWKKSELLKVIKSYDGPEYVTPDYQYNRWEVLAKSLVSLMPDKNYTCFRATGGTEAVELALKAAKSFNRREKFIAFGDAYHGQSFACMSLVRIADHDSHFGPFPSNFIQIKAGDWDAASKEAVKLIKKGDVCAFISEPIICNLGVLVPPKSFYEEIYKACKDSGTVFISDEVATGFGRTGKWFGFEHYGIKPDIVVVAKGFSSGYGAIGSAIVKREIAESMRFSFSNYSTYGWHPFSTEAAIANISYIKEKGLVERSEKSGAYLIKKLAEFCAPEGKGLCVGFGLKNQNYGTDCRKDGLIISAFDGRACLFPALDVKTAMR